MSLILDALKKLDREKSFLRNRPANIAVEILRPDLPRPARRTRLYLAVLFLTAVGTAAITYALMVGFGSVSKSSPPVPVNPPAPPPGQQIAAAPPEAKSLSKSSPSVPEITSTPKQQVGPAPPEASSLSKPSPPAPVNPPAPPPSQQVAPAPLFREPAGDAREEISPVPPSPKIKDPETSPGEKKENQNVVLEGKGIAPETARKPTGDAQPRSATTPPSLKLTAIVWYEEPSRRFAFINGMVTYEGGVIEGVKVVEIFPDRVRFLHNSQQFEIPLF